MSSPVVGESVERVDLREKLTGEARYTADLKLPGMLHGKVLRSPQPHAEVLGIDTTAARALPGVHAIVTPFDAPQGRLAPDMLVLDTRVRFVGDEVAAVAAEDEEIASRALGLIRLDYKALPFVLESEDALKPGAVLIHPEGNLVNGKPISLERGNVVLGFSQADLILEEEYVIPAHSPAPLEPRAALAHWEGDSLTVWKSSRGVHADRASLSRGLGIAAEKIRVVAPSFGGGYGAKDESRLAALAAVLALRSGRPVRIDYSHQEELVAGRTRHGSRIKVKIGVKRDGTITAVHTIATLNTGAYAASGSGVARRLGQSSLYLYHCPNAKYEASLVYTNRPVAGSYRALGAPQGHFALETLMDRVAESLGMDPLAFRRMNQVRPEGQPGLRTSPLDQIVDTQPVEGGIPFSSNGLDTCLRLGSEAFGWGMSKGYPSGGDPAKKIGRGMSMLIYRGGPGSTSAATLQVEGSGRVSLITGLVDVGEGASTVLAQLAASGLGTKYEDIDIHFADTASTPNAPVTAGSTATFSTGTAVVQAARELKQKLLEMASIGLEIPVDGLETNDGWVLVKYSPERRMSFKGIAERAGGESLSVTATVTPGLIAVSVIEQNVDYGVVLYSTDSTPSTSMSPIRFSAFPAKIICSLYKPFGTSKLNKLGPPAAPLQSQSM